MTHTTVKLISSCMITYGSNQYSVPPKYLGKRLVLQVYDNYLYVYDIIQDLYFISERAQKRFALSSNCFTNAVRNGYPGK